MSDTEDPGFAVAPVENDGDEELTDGIGIALSGGGYRAMLFHLGFLWRLRDARLLKDADRISSVSGGSITAGALALAWPNIAWNDDGASFRRQVVDPIIALAHVTIDIPGALIGRIPGMSGTYVRSSYDKHLFHGATLQDLPDEPRFIFNATSLHSGKLFRFSKPYLAEWSFGRWMNPNNRLSEAVAASSAFPPVLSPVTTGVAGLVFDPAGGKGRKCPAAFRLTDGGVYDNLGLETLWKRKRTLFVSDGGAGFDYQDNPSSLLSLQALRVTIMMQDQIGMLRARQMIAGYNAPAGSPLKRTGFLASIGTQMKKDRPAGALPYNSGGADMMAATKTALRSMDDNHIKRLINWGYILADDRLRSSPDFSHLPPPNGLPFPGSAV
ncbi:patatin-like phospholipase family protein [Sphingomonas sp. RB56-2]|uniref:Patatin-like phospholipase family protein n=1 Tax=Sphingomonas brevis TaxID=2908206 RepID=A0ABT0SBK3_9SPHN|nr:patatin-like phospholipase family protein [Sphingomonas brevis]